MNKKSTIIVNPASAAGRTVRTYQLVLASLRGGSIDEFSLFVTKAPLEATMIARQAIIDGSDLIIAVGGDGTVNEVVNGFFEDGQLNNAECVLGILVSGTGRGLANSLGLPEKIEDQIAVVKNRQFRTIDVCKLTYADFSGIMHSRYFVNECQIGIGAKVVDRVQTHHKAFGGRIAFAWGALKSIVRDKAESFTFRIDRGKEERLQLHGIAIGNGSRMGGGMNLVPRAQLDDGLFDALLIHRHPLFGRLRSFSKVYAGKHIELPQFTYQQCTSISVESSNRVLVAADGELLGTLPCSVEIIPRVLPVCVPSRKEANHETS